MKKIGILALVLALIMCFSTISAYAGISKVSSQMPFVDSDQITPQHPEIQTEDEMMEEFNNMFGEKGKIVLGITIFGVLFAFLFLPCLVTVIVFSVLNSKNKKKIREYERIFGPIPQNSAYYNPAVNNNPYYGARSVNPMNTPMGTPPSGNNTDIQGGQFR